MSEKRDEETGRKNRTLVRRLYLRDFRNFREAVLEPAARFNLIYGENGHGKTSLIEALYVLATTKSFRGARLLETVREDCAQAELGAKVESFGLQQELKASIGARSRSFAVDGKRPRDRLSYALRTPVIAFYPGDVALVSGPATARRTLLDRVMLYIDKAGAAAQMAYKEALRDRQKLLEMGTSDRQLDAYERVIAQHGARFALGRQRAAEQVTTGLLVSFRRMAPPDLECAATYHPGGSVDAENFAAELLARRQKDRFRKAATFGPHRDELLLSVSGRPARSHASQGQQRLLSLAMKLAELDCVKTATATDPLLLLDDVSSELDAARTRAVFDFLADSQSQIFVTTTRPELFSTVQMSLPDRAEFQVSNGTLQRGIR